MYEDRQLAADVRQASWCRAQRVHPQGRRRHRNGAVNSDRLRRHETAPIHRDGPHAMASSPVIVAVPVPTIVTTPLVTLTRARKV